MDYFQPVGRMIQHKGIQVPTFLYGTAWKEHQTEALTQLALETGFLGIDTANQRRHYLEAGVGEAVHNLLRRRNLQRGDLFLQTKFTYAAGQDQRLPYEAEADHATQVIQSLDSSLDHLRTDYVDSYILHGPSLTRGLSEADQEVWRTMAQLPATGKVKLIGVSNFGYEQLNLLIETAQVAPAFVQNRCFARTKWDARVRELCKANDIAYQGFSILTANTMELSRPAVQRIAGKLGCTVPQAVFRFCLQVGIIPLTGTSSEYHMREDLAAYEVELSAADVETIANAAFI